MFFKHTVTPQKRGIVSSVLLAAGLVVSTLIILVAVAACAAGSSGGGGDTTTIAAGMTCTVDDTCVEGHSCSAGTGTCLSDTSTAIGASCEAAGAVCVAESECNATTNLCTVPAAGVVTPATPILTVADDGFINIADNTGGYTIMVVPVAGSSFAVDDVVALTDGTNPLSPARMATVDAASTDGVDIAILAGGLTDGVYTIGARVTAGESSVDSDDTLDFTVDLTAPSAPDAPTSTVASASDRFINIADNTGGYTIMVAPVTGSTFAVDDVVALTDGTDPLSPAQMATVVAASTDGVDIAILAGGLTDGVYTLGATVRDVAGNVSSASSTLDFTVDTVATAFTTIAPPPSAIATSGTAGSLNFSYTAPTDANVSFVVLLESMTAPGANYAGITAATGLGTNGEMTDVAGTGSSQTHTVSGLTGGTAYTVYWVVRDEAGNESAFGNADVTPTS